MSDPNRNPETRIALFQRKEVRRAIHNNEWWFVITDVVTVLTDSVDASGYLKKLRKRDPSLGEVFKGGGQIVPPLGLEFDTAGGRQLLQCWNTEGIFRLIQSIPSPKAEPFKRWLPRVGYERIQEIEDPELYTSSSPPPWTRSQKHSRNAPLPACKQGATSSSRIINRRHMKLPTLNSSPGLSFTNPRN
jgi:hypothetical protein